MERLLYCGAEACAQGNTTIPVVVSKANKTILLTYQICRAILSPVSSCIRNDKPGPRVRTLTTRLLTCASISELIGSLQASMIHGTEPMAIRFCTIPPAAWDTWDTFICIGHSTCWSLSILISTQRLRIPYCHAKRLLEYKQRPDGPKSSAKSLI